MSFHSEAGTPPLGMTFRWVTLGSKNWSCFAVFEFSPMYGDRSSSSPSRDLFFDLTFEQFYTNAGRSEGVKVLGEGGEGGKGGATKSNMMIFRMVRE